MSLGGPVVKITAGAIAGLLSVGTGVAIHVHSSGGGGNSAANVDGSTATGTGHPDADVEAVGSLAEGGVGDGGGAATNANGGSGGRRASAGANAQTSRPGLGALPRLGPVGASINLPLQNARLGSTQGGGTGGSGNNQSNGGGGGGGGGGGQPGVGSVPPLNSEGSHTVVVPGTSGVDKYLCLAVAGPAHCERITVDPVPGATVTVAWAGNASAQPPAHSVSHCDGGLVITITGLTPGASVTVKVNGHRVLSASVPSHGVPVLASLCDA